MPTIRLPVDRRVDFYREYNAWAARQLQESAIRIYVQSDTRGPVSGFVSFYNVPNSLVLALDSARLPFERI